MNYKIGCHVSIAGGVWNAPLRALELGCETFQIFSRSPQGGPAPKLTPDVVEQFKEGMKQGGFTDFVIHAPYYINFGSPKITTLKSSIAIVRDELERGTILGASWVMFHPGSLNGNTEGGLEQAKEGIAEVLKGYKGTTKLLVEISAGAGQVLGDTFEELQNLTKGLESRNGFGGICFDTQHAFASGYDLRDEKTVEKVLNNFDEVLGLENLRMSHVNDSKVELSSHKDRHEHLGQGLLGTKGIGNFLKILDKKSKIHKNENVFPLILETDHDKVKEDIKILKQLRIAL